MCKNANCEKHNVLHNVYYTQTHIHGGSFLKHWATSGECEERMIFVLWAEKEGGLVFASVCVCVRTDEPVYCKDDQMRNRESKQGSPERASPPA